MKAPVVADTTVWSNFAHAGDPRLAQHAFPNIASPRAVLAEIAEGTRLGHLGDFDWTFIDQLELTDTEAALAKRLEQTLDAGEAACIALATSRDSLLLTDDRDARRAARAAGVEVSGTLGVLACLVASGRVDEQEANRLLRRMIEAGYRSPFESITGIL